jgi:hypothetical protein
LFGGFQEFGCGCAVAGFDLAREFDEGVDGLGGWGVELFECCGLGVDLFCGGVHGTQPPCLL